MIRVPWLYKSEMTLHQEQKNYLLDTRPKTPSPKIHSECNIALRANKSRRQSPRGWNSKITICHQLKPPRYPYKVDLVYKIAEGSSLNEPIYESNLGPHHLNNLMKCPTGHLDKCWTNTNSEQNGHTHTITTKESSGHNLSLYVLEPRLFWVNLTVFHVVLCL